MRAQSLVHASRRRMRSALVCAAGLACAQLAAQPAHAGALAERFAAAPDPLALVDAQGLPAPTDAADRVAAAALAHLAADPASARAAWSAAPIRTRTGQPRLPVEAGAPSGPVLLARALWSTASDDERGAALAAAARLQPDWAAIAPLLLATEGPALRRMTADLLVDAPSSLARAPITTAAADPDPRVRAAAMRALGGQPAQLAPAALRAGATDPDPAVRTAALTSAGHVGLDAVAAEAQAALGDPHGSVRLAAGQALKRLDPAAFAAAKPAMARDPDARVRQLALLP